MRRRSLLQSAAVMGVAIALPAAAAPFRGAKSLAEQFAATLTAHDMAAFAALFSDEYVNHQTSAAAPAPSDRTPKQITVGLFTGRLAGLPDLKVAIEMMVVSDDKVAASFVYTGTHTGPFFGAAPTGHAVRFTSCDIFRVHKSQIVEHWGMGDIAGIAAQLRA